MLASKQLRQDSEEFCTQNCVRTVAIYCSFGPLWAAAVGISLLGMARSFLEIFAKTLNVLFRARLLPPYNTQQTMCGAPHGTEQCHEIQPYTTTINKQNRIWATADGIRNYQNPLASLPKTIVCVSLQSNIIFNVPDTK